MCDINKTEIMPNATVVLDQAEINTGITTISLSTEIIQGQKGKYEILEELNTLAGGEADLYFCRKVGETEKLVAKIYRKNNIIKQDEREKLLDFLLSINLNTTDIAPILDHGTFMGRIFDIYPYFEEGDLSKKGKFTFKELLNKIIPAMNETLKVVHDAGIIHRDIKPSNFFYYNGRVILGDFGIASSKNFTEVGRGTIGYRAVEVKSSVVDKKTDYFALGPTIASLYLGQDIYEGKDISEILHIMVNRTMTDYIEFQKGDEDLKILIQGLTSNDIATRFGYEEVKLWCQNPKNKSLLIQETDDSDYTGFRMPYNFDDERYYDSRVLQAALGTNWDKAKKHLYRGLLEHFFKTENQELSYKTYQITESICKDNQDLGLFMFLSYLNKSGPIYWRNKEYQNLSNISLLMNQNPLELNADILDLLKFKGISWRIELNKNLNQVQKDTLSTLHKIEEHIDKGEIEIGYYLFMFSFLPSDSDRFILINDKKLYNLEAIFDHLVENRNNLLDVSESIVRYEAFYGYLYYLGFIESGLTLRNSLTDSKEDNFMNLMKLLESTIRTKTKITEFYVQFGPKSHLYWLKNNLHLYNFYGDNAKELKKEFENIKFKKSMSLIEVEELFVDLLNLKMEFDKLFLDNIYLTNIGIYDDKDLDGIMSTKLDAFYTHNYLGTKVPEGFKKYLEKSKKIKWGAIR